jgi:hypothetical protein
MRDGKPLRAEMHPEPEQAFEAIGASGTTQAN